MIRVWLTDLFKALLRVQPQVTGPYRAYQTTRSTGGFDCLEALARREGIVYNRTVKEKNDA